MQPVILFLKSIFSDTEDYNLTLLDNATFEYLLSAGLGPLLNHYTENTSSYIKSPYRNTLTSSKFTSQVLIGNHIETLLDIIKADRGVTRNIVLLKGISTATRLYPEPYMRIMGDIDIFIDDANLKQLTSNCIELGYIQKSAEELPHSFYEKIHHDMPFYNPENGVCVEIHHLLFPPSSAISSDDIFTSENIQKHSHDGLFNDEKIKYLEVEYELTYICAHLVVEHNWHKSLMRLVDMLYLLHYANKEFNWDKLVGCIDKSPLSAAYLYLVLSFLKKYDLVNIPVNVLSNLYRSQTRFNKMNVYILHSLMYCRLIKGRDFGGVLTENIADIIWKTMVHGKKSPILSFLSIFWNVVFLPGHPKKYNPLFILNRIKKMIM